MVLRLRRPEHLPFLVLIYRHRCSIDRLTTATTRAERTLPREDRWIVCTIRIPGEKYRADTDQVFQFLVERVRAEGKTAQWNRNLLLLAYKAAQLNHVGYKARIDEQPRNGLRFTVQEIVHAALPDSPAATFAHSMPILNLNAAPTRKRCLILSVCACAMVLDSDGMHQSGLNRGGGEGGGGREVCAGKAGSGRH